MPKINDHSQFISADQLEDFKVTATVKLRRDLDKPGDGRGAIEVVTIWVPKNDNEQLVDFEMFVYFFGEA